jgi:hypothetical protein
MGRFHKEPGRAIMTSEKLRSVFKFYEEHIREYHPELSPTQMDDDCTRIKSPHISDDMYWGHMLFMTVQGQKFVDLGKIEKAMRWLGFLQGILWEDDHFTLDDLKNHSRPDLVEGD